ncbi:hypothetical protein BofuT4_uP144390.1 [Botrytis cinerea T4]|uniref:Uncharacterized protein n=1 Tax=Botryotinia fuckeliana (strain T4) TaxID=999810 RepID=G2YYD3_BOTF4|nr:hypothetical protein BofuT4_uP144390.1 [Botrytis cinerea T4]
MIDHLETSQRVVADERTDTEFPIGRLVSRDGRW